MQWEKWNQLWSQEPGGMNGIEQMNKTEELAKCRILL